MSGSILVASIAPSQSCHMAAIKDAASSSILTIVQSGAEARRLIMDEEWDTIILDLPLPDEKDSDLCRMIGEKTFASLVVIVPDDLVDTTSSVVEDYGAVVIGRPLDPVAFSYVLKFARSMRRRIAMLHQKNSRLESKLDEVKLVDRAKIALVHYLDMTEAQAHRYIEKQAMDLRIPRIAVARRILKTYE
ncbi:ANTAR domain-containing response regulator [Parasphaerochaeta coccoides]|uniref:ANTAR domain protein n=1 Tax=Parasphaerochaeta coccoides (strain ATCC BAA-1237 / DSM 17374 / SPN1) TaxID=760011 RepID=F4GLU0_PARC1|nr:ANTAR domain-containing protein [Parasphaerochaeta coccoides]AEC02981.1 ANTAR domain protein [Parasphaerochaeta coccoides DSM 17374]